MLRIDSTTLYTREDLERELGGMMSLETFLEGLPLARPYKKAYWGADLIRAINEVHEAGRPRYPAAVPVGPSRPQGGSRLARKGEPLERVQIPRE